MPAAHAAHPERFIRAIPQPPALPTAVWINPPATEVASIQIISDARCLIGLGRRRRAAGRESRDE
jgi:hypothetical protein